MVFDNSDVNLRIPTMLEIVKAKKWETDENA